MSAKDANVCDINEPLKPATACIVTRARLQSAKTKQQRIEALCDFASYHGLFSDEPELQRHARCLD